VTDTVEVDHSQLLRQFGHASTAGWRNACERHHNMLLVGSEAATEAVLVLLEPHLREPVVWKRPRAPFEAPPGACRSLVLQDVAALSGEEQARLLGWLDDPSQLRQVVSTTTHPLFQLVTRGLFDEVLYYRLNVMLLHVDSSNHPGLYKQDAEALTSSRRRPEFELQQ